MRMRSGSMSKFERVELEWLRPYILFALLAQNTSYTLFRRYLTAGSGSSDIKIPAPSSKEILLVSEIIKLCVSMYMILYHVEDSPPTIGSIGNNHPPENKFQKLISLTSSSWKMGLLAGIYLIMNLFSFISLQYIGAGEFTVCAQLKILTTAGFSVLILGTSLSETKWRALALLVIGCILVAIPGLTTSSSSHFTSSSPSTNQQLFLSSAFFLGYGAVIAEVILSGFASIYFEKIIKSTTEIVSIWERNFQLSLYSIVIYSVMIWYDQLSSSGVNVTQPIFSNWSFLALVVSILGSLGGLLVAASLKYADSILKTLATAGAIIVTTFLGHLLLNGPFSHEVIIGSLVTVIAILNYTKDTSTGP
jgi:solute carrier family 35 (UDP-sugar transporter), member A1/2/3